MTVNIDTVKPHAKTPSAAKVRRYRMATLEYEVDDVDPNGGTARVTILVKDRRGDVVKRLRLGTKPARHGPHGQLQVQAARRHVPPSL